MITNFQAAFEDFWNNSDNKFHNLYLKANRMTERVGKARLTKPRTVGRQILRNNVSSDTQEDYWRHVIASPFLGCLKNNLAINFKVN